VQADSKSNRATSGGCGALDLSNLLADLVGRFTPSQVYVGMFCGDPDRGGR